MKELTTQEKEKLFKLFQKIAEKEFRLEVSYSESYLQKVKTFYYSASKRDIYLYRNNP